MSINQDLGNGGYNIVPSARRSIHWYRNCPFARDMGRYGENSSDDEQPEGADVGVDEVDNVMSKFAHSSSPLAVRRRNSLTPPNLQHNDDSEEHGAHAKSLPARLPSRSSRLHYSDDSRHAPSDPTNRSVHNKSDYATPRSTGDTTGDGRNYGFASTSPNKTHRMSTSPNIMPRMSASLNIMPRMSTSPNIMPRMSTSPNLTHRISRSPNISHRINQSIHSNRELQKKSSRETFFIYSLGVLLPVLLAAYYYDFFSSVLESHHQVQYDEAKFHNDLNELGAKYKVGDDSILQLQAGISTIFKREDTSCVVFLYNSKNNDYDPSKFDAFVNNVVSNAAKFLRNDTSSVQHIVVEGSELSMLSHSQLVKAYREDVARAGALLVRDVEHVPSPLAMAFHYYCDEYNPLVKKSAIFFTMNTARCPGAGEKSSHASVERCLKEKWSTVPQDNIGPLLTRIVSIVVDVTSGV